MNENCFKSRKGSTAVSSVHYELVETKNYKEENLLIEQPVKVKRPNAANDRHAENSQLVEKIKRGIC